MESRHHHHDLSDPVEYKDEPIDFTFVLDGREEPIKIVEPVIDLPFPEGGCLQVDIGKIRVCEVVFRFDLNEKNPYRLVFNIREGIHNRDGQVFTYGAGVVGETKMGAEYLETILERGNVLARVEMTRGKARLLIRYQKEGEK
jgi:hypothetical protein